MNYKYVILSDLHLGSGDSNPKKIENFLESINFDKLILNGDIIDGWKLKMGGKIKKKEAKLIKYFISLSEKKEIIYLRGNHDDFLDDIVPIKFGEILIGSSYDLYVDNKKYLVVHGDVFDKTVKDLKWIAYIGDLGYTCLIKINKFINYIRSLFGLKYYSTSKQIKKGVKKAVAYIFEFEISLAKLAKSKGYDGIICGHIHDPQIKKLEGIEYLNSGDWVESMSALVYSEKNGWEILFYENS